MSDQVIDYTGTMNWKHGTTWYRVIGDLKSKKTPVFVIHGGPGVSHNYMIGMANLIHSTGRPVILYDQIGCGLSTQIKDKPDEFWKVDLFKEELNLLIKELKVAKSYLIAGNSWGGILAFAHAVDRPKGLKGLVIANSVASIPKWIPEIQRLVAELPPVHRKAIEKAMKVENFTTLEFQAASHYFEQQHLLRVPATPDVAKSFELLAENSTVYNAMWGPAEFAPTGTLHNWSVEDKLKNIKIPTLLISGKYDEVTPKSQKRLVKKIKGAEWVCLPYSSHLAWVEEPAAWIHAVNSFFKRKKI